MDDLQAFAGEMEEVALQLSLYSRWADTALTDTNLAKTVLRDLQAEYQRLEMAAALYHFPSVEALARHINADLESYYATLPEAGIELLLGGQLIEWLELCSICLREPDADEHLPALHATLTSEHWPEALPLALITELMLALRSSTHTPKSPETNATSEANPTHETPLFQTATITENPLAWAPDTHPELLAAYLQETPEQVEQTCELMQLIARQEATPEQKRQAARYAHTIKGSSAILGITPLVQFTHQLEDLLELDIQAWIDEGLGNTLSVAADHLVHLFDNLRAQRPLPANHAELVQALAEWQKRVKTQAPTSTESDDEPEVTAPHLTLLPDFITVGGQDALNTTTPAASSTHITVPMETLQHLLNLAGEIITCNTRLQAQIQTADSTIRTIIQHDDRIQRLFEEMEDSIEQQAQTPTKLPQTQTDELVLEHYHSLHSTYALLSESILDTRELNRTLRQQLRDMNEQIQRQKQWQQELSTKLLNTRMVPAQSLVNRLERTVRETCRTTNKQAQIIVSGADLMLDTDIAQALNAPLLHMVRNAIDHGIELPGQRQVLGKPATGLLKLDFSRQQGRMRISLEDDGAGLDLAAIRARAEAQGIIRPEQELSDHATMQLILLPGFSTRDTVSETSGRGVGMDVVHHAVTELRGQLRLDSKSQQGTSVKLELPLAMVTTHALVTRAGEHWVAIPADTIQSIVQIELSAQFEEQGQRYAHYKGQTLKVYPLVALLDWVNPNTKLQSTTTLLLVETDEFTCLIQADEVSTAQDLVVKSLAPWHNLSRFVYGASILSNGTIVPVIDIQRLLTLDVLPQERMQRNRINPHATSRDQQTILVVDDSMSNRRAMTQILEPLGFQVLTARDGYNGLQVLREQAVDLVLTDLEMPQMNGLELTQAVRIWPERQSLPVIMLTSRSTQKHRQMALNAGVNAYLTKPVEPATLQAQITALLT